MRLCVREHALDIYVCLCIQAQSHTYTYINMFARYMNKQIAKKNKQINNDSIKSLFAEH